MRIGEVRTGFRIPVVAAARALASAACLAIGCATSPLDPGLDGSAASDAGSTKSDAGTGGPGGGKPTVPCPAVGKAVVLEQLHKAMVGDWAGTATSPWTLPYEVAVTFRSNDSYSAHSTSAGAPTAFYYGTDANVGGKNYLLDNVLINGDGEAQIDIGWDFSAPTRGSLSRIRACTTSDGTSELSFEFYADWIGRAGPIVYTLAKAH